MNPSPRACWCLLFLVVGCWGRGAAAQDDAAVQPLVLQSPGSARSAGFAGAGAALIGDAAIVFHNPAGMATIRRLAVEGAYHRIAEGASESMGAAVIRWRRLTVGGGVKYIAFGGDENGESPRAYEFLGVGSMIYRFSMIAMGGSGKVVRRVSGDVEERGVSADIGAALAVFDIMALGFAIQNFRGNWDEESAIEMRRLARFGWTLHYLDPQGTLRLMSTLEWQWPEEQRGRTILGLEGGVVPPDALGIKARAAIKARGKTPGEPRFSMGLSVTLGRFAADYAFEPDSPAGASSHRFGVRLGF